MEVATYIATVMATVSAAVAYATLRVTRHALRQAGPVLLTELQAVSTSTGRPTELRDWSAQITAVLLIRNLGSARARVSEVWVDWLYECDTAVSHFPFAHQLVLDRGHDPLEAPPYDSVSIETTFQAGPFRATIPGNYNSLWLRPRLLLTTGQEAQGTDTVVFNFPDRNTDPLSYWRGR